MQALIVSTATRVGMGNLVGVVAAISAGGAGAVFWMWVIALLGSSTAFAEATLGSALQGKGPSLRGVQRGTGLLYTQLFYHEKGKQEKEIRGAVLLCPLRPSVLGGVSQVIGNSVSSCL